MDPSNNIHALLDHSNEPELPLSTSINPNGVSCFLQKAYKPSPSSQHQ